MHKNDLTFTNLNCVVKRKEWCYLVIQLLFSICYCSATHQPSSSMHLCVTFRRTFNTIHTRVLLELHNKSLIVYRTTSMMLWAQYNSYSSKNISPTEAHRWLQFEITRTTTIFAKWQKISIQFISGNLPTSKRMGKMRCFIWEFRAFTVNYYNEYQRTRLCVVGPKVVKAWLLAWCAYPITHPSKVGAQVECTLPQPLHMSPWGPTWACSCHGAHEIATPLCTYGKGTYYRTTSSCCAPILLYFLEFLSQITFKCT